MISDIHGNYNAYMDMLKKIQFDDDDIFYILGDILDRGPNPIQIILDVMKRPNVEVLAGNHSKNFYNVIRPRSGTFLHLSQSLMYTMKSKLQEKHIF